MPTASVDLGVELLRKVERELTVKEAVDRVELISGEPRFVREVLAEARRRGVVEREGTTVRPRGGDYVRFESEVTAKEGEFSCRRCGASLSTGHFVEFDAGELGPFGSSCVRKVTGRD